MLLASLTGLVVALAWTVANAGGVSPKRLVDVVDLSTPSVSPDGTHVAFRAEQASVERSTYDSVWYVQRTDGRAPPRRVGDGGVPLRDSAGGSFPAEAVWSSDGRYIFYRALLDGRVDVWRAAADGSRTEPMTFDPADVRGFSLSADGRVLRYRVGATRAEVERAEQEEYDRGIHLDESLPVGAGLFRSSFVDGRLGTQRYTGSWFTRGPLLADVPERARELDLETGARREVSEETAGATSRPENADSFALAQVVLEVRDPSTGRIAVIRRADGGDRTRRTDRTELSILREGRARDPRACTAEACTGRAISGVRWHPARDELLFTVTDREEGESQSIHGWDLAADTVRLIARSRGFINGGRERSSACGASADALFCVAAEADGPPRLERIDFESGHRHVLFAPNAALAADLATGLTARLLRWRDDQGRELTGQLFVGRQGPSQPRPLFINYYRCMGFLRGGMGDEWPLASLAEAGIATLCINAPPLDGDPVQRFDRAVDAVKSAVDHLEAEGLVDRHRVGMGGLSFGSEVALWVAMQSDALSAVSVTSPSVTPLYYLMGSAKGTMFTSGLKTIWGLGSPDETPEQWQRLSPTYNLDRIRVPVLFQMPEEEYLYALDYAIPLIRARRADLYVFPHEPHRKFQPRHMLAAYERNLDWFRFWLQGVEDPEPGKARQYARWRAMRAGGPGAEAPQPGGR